MNIHDTLRNRRKSLGLTQEQVANHLGITAPAVNKWEKGLSCPDILLLPMLARLLKTDPNTLLCFQENLSNQEIGMLLNKISETIQSDGFQQGYALAKEEMRAYPHCGTLKYNLALLLVGAITHSNLPADDAKQYEFQLDTLFQELTMCDDGVLANNARYMLASKYLKQEEFEKTQELLNQIPLKSSVPDTQILQADLLEKQGKAGEAATILERMALSSLQESLMAVTKLIPILVAEDKIPQAKQLAHASRMQYEAFGLWRYGAHLAILQLAVSEKDIPESLSAIEKLLDACMHPWNASTCPLFLHQPTKEGIDTMGSAFLSSLLLELERNDDYAFLHDSPAFSQLIQSYQQEAK